ncbi:MAG: right-handed parallel beta-helix repeat-containing protein [Acetatifactor sp.]|nr:right-handed parallel beta-helix repeat-containing protein [Acetatifactor sp.]
MKYYVSCNQEMSGDGSRGNPFRTIGEAAESAEVGDEVIVLPGIYREWVNPPRGGDGERRIIYRAQDMGTAVITGAEPIRQWEHFQEDVWTARVPNSLFGDYNPYDTLIAGDWYMASRPRHTGEVYLDGRSLYEAGSLEEVLKPVLSEASWDREFSNHVWYAAVADKETQIYINLQGKLPGEHTLEINVRRFCFYPEKTGVNYITVSGFVMKQAATAWAPPTACQEGLMGPHWSRGWIIEDCEISDSRCCGISLGKLLQPHNDNKWTKKLLKVGTQNERDIVCQAWKDGWNKENIGSHIIRRCHIHDCGQAGIVGHLGCIFSVIEDNHIHHINHKQELWGAETGGIKLHAAIDTSISRNHIHHCTRGIWLDWQAQGTRVSGNLFHHNVTPKTAEICYRLGVGEDLFIEVSHGPTLVDNNIFLSEFSCRLSAQGLAFVHNLFAGSFTMVGQGTNNGLTGSNPRYTPYHEPHGTAVDGFMTILHGDARFYNNLFVKKYTDEEYARFEKLGQYGPPVNTLPGLCPYDGYPDGDSYFEAFSDGDWKNVERYYGHLPVWTGGNAFFNGAAPRISRADREGPGAEGTCGEFVDTMHCVRLEYCEEDGQGYLETDLYQYLPKDFCRLLETKKLGEAFEPEQRFENPDSSDIIFDLDYSGKKRENVCLCGPFAERGERISVLS